MLDLGSIKRELKEDLRPRKMIRYALVPHFGGVLNPLKDVFALLVRTIALLFVQSNLLPKDHPVMLGEVRGVGAIWLMIVDASANLKFNKQNIPQIAVFYAIVGMIVFSVLGTLTFLLRLGVGPAHAATASYFDDTGSTAGGWIDAMLPYAGGGSGVAAALGGTLTIYNSAVLVLATGMALWTIIFMILESAHHGEVGGKRHSELFAPLRLIMAIGLLVPVSNGYNSAQIITIQIAHAGSGLANTVWKGFQTNFLNVNNAGAFTPSVDLNVFSHDLLWSTACSIYMQKQPGASGVPTQQITNYAPGSTSVITGYTINFNYQTNDAYCGSVQIGAPDANLAPGQSTVFLNVFNSIYNRLKPVAQTIVTNNDVTDPANAAQATPTLPDGNWSAMLSDFQGQFTTAATQLATTNQGNVASSVSTLQSQVSQQWVDAGAVFFRLSKLAQDNIKVQAIQVSSTPPNAQLLPSETKGQGGMCYIVNPTDGNVTETDCTPSAQQASKILGKISTYVNSMQAASGAAITTGVGDNGGVNSSYSNMFVNVLMNKAGGQAVVNSIVNGFNSNLSFGTIFYNLAMFGQILAAFDAGMFAAAAVAGASFIGFSFGPGLPLVLAIFASFLFPISLIFAVYIPLLPATRFIFGILSWLLVIFEAMLALPIVALWQIRGEGEGLLAHGKEGYLLILQMMLRPVLMVFGLIGSIIVFGTIFQFIFSTVFTVWWNFFKANGVSSVAVGTAVAGPAGFVVTSMTDVVILFMFIVFLCFLVYSVANVCFDLINQIPDRILLWIGTAGFQHKEHDAYGATQNSLSGVRTGLQQFKGIPKRTGGDIPIGGGTRTEGGSLPASGFVPDSDPGPEPETPSLPPPSLPPAAPAPSSSGSGVIGPIYPGSVTR